MYSKFHYPAIFAAALVMGAGLQLSGMVDPVRILSFLDIAAIGTAAWDASLALVMMGALLVTLPGFHWLLRRSQPFCGSVFHLSNNQKIDARLIIGSTLFGIGWGMVGYCPGPALVNLLQGSADIFIFVLAMLGGMILAPPILKLTHPLKGKAS